MHKDKRLLAIVPARSGSKGLPDKNIKSLCGKPLIAHTIGQARETGLFDGIVVSTDSEKYAEVARQYGAEVPFLRPEELAQDTSLASEYIVYTLQTLAEQGREYDYFVLLQPTSPLRKPEHIMQGVELAVRECLDGVVAFSESECPVEYLYELPQDMNLAALQTMREANRQEHRARYRVNGMLYVCDCGYYLQNHTFYGPRSKALIIERKYAVDIDSEFDFTLAEFLMERERHG